MHFLPENPPLAKLMMDWKNEFDWEVTLEEIRQQKCVLVIGPDLVNYENDQTLFQLLGQQLARAYKWREYLDLKSSYIFEHDELLQ